VRVSSRKFKELLTPFLRASNLFLPGLLIEKPGRAPTPAARMFQEMDNCNSSASFRAVILIFKAQETAISCPSFWGPSFIGDNPLNTHLSADGGQYQSVSTIEEEFHFSSVVDPMLFPPYGGVLSIGSVENTSFYASRPPSPRFRDFD